MKLSLRDVSFSYGPTRVLNGLSLEVPDHVVAVVLGPNGAGKTTLLKCINGMLKPSSGTVMLGNDPVEKLTPGRIARICAFLTQQNQPGRLTAFDSVLLGRKPGMGWRVTGHDLAHTEAALQATGIRHLALRHTDSMSGGEFKKVCLARAIAQEPSIMLLDEPTASLDLKSRLSFMDLLRTIVHGHRMSAVVTMHDLNTAFRYGDVFFFMKDGRIEAGVGREGISPEIIGDVYGVKVIVHSHAGVPFAVPADPVSFRNPSSP
jgi:iron complex transport system ATP-binding protein